MTRPLLAGAVKEFEEKRNRMRWKERRTRIGRVVLAVVVEHLVPHSLDAGFLGRLGRVVALSSVLPCVGPDQNTFPLY